VSNNVKYNFVENFMLFINKQIIRRLQLIALASIMAGCITIPIPDNIPLIGKAQNISTQRWWPSLESHTDSQLLKKTVNLQSCLKEDKSLRSVEAKPPYRAGAWIHPRSLRTKPWHDVLSGNKGKDQEESSIGLSIAPYIIDGYGRLHLVAPDLGVQKPTSDQDNYKPFSDYHVVCDDRTKAQFLPYPHYYSTLLLTTPSEKQLQQLENQLKTAVEKDKWLELTTGPILLEQVENIQMGELVKLILSPPEKKVQLAQRLDIHLEFRVNILGLGNDTTPSTVTSRLLDSTPPTLTITSPQIITTREGRGLARVQTERITLTGIAKDDSGVAKVNVQGQPATLDKSGGHFKATVTLQKGENTLIVKAWDNSQNRAEKTMTLLLGPYHIVQTDETLENIAINNGQKLMALAQWNNLVPPYHLQEGQILRLAPLPLCEGGPAPSCYHDTAPPTITITSPQIITTRKGRGLARVQTEQVTIKGFAEDDYGVAQVQVQGQLVFQGKQGKPAFSVTLTVPQGESIDLKVTALDISGNSAKETFILSRIASLPQTGDYHALLIGNQSYRHLSSLKTPENDVKVIAELLKNNYGFNTELLLNADRRNILDALNRLQQTIKPQDNLLIYYAGHGHYDKERDRAYWLPVDADQNRTAQRISADDITSEMRALSARHILVVADSCYSGTLATDNRSMPIPVQQRIGFLQRMLEKPSRTLMASGGNEPVWDGGGDGHSVFARAFITALQEADKTLFTAEELFYNYKIRETVAGKAVQVPKYEYLKHSGHAGGDFVFKKHP
jgi:LysM repeat protein